MVKFLKNLTLVYQSAALFRDEKLKRAEVSGYQARYLLAVSDEEGISQDKLASRLLVNKSNVARQVSALEALGYLRREQSAEDKRVMLVHTTDKGKELIPVIREVNAKWRQILCRGIGEEKQRELADILDTMVKNAREYLKDTQ